MSSSKGVQNDYRKINQNAYFQGEKLFYKLGYGFITAGEADINIDTKLYKINNRICHRMSILGRTVGAFSLVVPVNDYFESYIDTNAVLPIRSSKSQEENKFRYKEKMDFDHINGNVRVEAERKETKFYKISNDVLDLVSGYYYLRTINFDKYKINDTISIKAFYEDSSYTFKLIYFGKTKLKTTIGTINSRVLSPIMPYNSLFRGKYPLKLWLSDDLNKIPLKVKAELVLGSLEIEINRCSGLRNPLNVIK